MIVTEPTEDRGHFIVIELGDGVMEGGIWPNVWYETPNNYGQWKLIDTGEDT